MPFNDFVKYRQKVKDYTKHQNDLAKKNNEEMKRNSAKENQNLKDFNKKIYENNSQEEYLLSITKLIKLVNLIMDNAIRLKILDMLREEIDTANRLKELKELFIDMNSDLSRGDDKLSKFIDIDLIRQQFSTLEIRLKSHLNQSRYELGELLKSQLNLEGQDQEIKKEMFTNVTRILDSRSYRFECFSINYTVPENNFNVLPTNAELYIDSNVIAYLLTNFSSDLKNFSFLSVDEYFLDKAREFFIKSLAKKFNFEFPLLNDQYRFIENILSQPSFNMVAEHISKKAHSVLLQDDKFSQNYAKLVEVQTDRIIIESQIAAEKKVISMLEAVDLYKGSFDHFIRDHSSEKGAQKFINSVNEIINLTGELKSATNEVTKNVVERKSELLEKLKLSRQNNLEAGPQGPHEAGPPGLSR